LKTRLIITAGLALINFASVSIPSARAEGNETSTRTGKLDTASVEWRFNSDFPDGRRFISDGGLVIDSRYVAGITIPEKSLPPDNVKRLLDSKTDREFKLSDVNPMTGGEHYLAPGPIQLNRKYVDILRASPKSGSLSFRSKGSTDPVLIMDGNEAVGVVMPMKMAQ
jgi:hypothetical protein